MPKKTFVLCVLGLSFHINAHGQDFEIINNDVTQVSSSLNHAVFLNDSAGFAVGGYGFGTGVIIKTTDYGNTWTRTDVERNLFQVYFVNEIIGYAVGEGATILKTIDGGESWEYQNADIVSSAFQFRTVVFLNPDTGFIGTANGPGFAFLSTYNGGSTWENAAPGSVGGRARLQIINDSIVYALPFGNRFYRTSDHGQSWSFVSLPEDTGSSRDMFFFNKDTGIVAIREFSSSCGSNFHLAITTDGGQNWTTQYFECENFGSFAFPTDLIGYASGSSYSMLGIRTMWRTIDGGLSWQNLEYPVSEEHAFTGCVATAFACVNQDTCYMPTNYGTIIKMTNATGGLVSTMQEEVESSNKLQVYPNPNNGLFKVRLSHNEKITRIAIYSMDGIKVYDDSFFTPNDEIQINASDVESGLYAITVYTTGKIHSGKFIKL